MNGATKGAAQRKRPNENHPDFATMTSLEIARYIRALMTKNNLRQAEAAKSIGYSPSYVSQLLRLLELPDIFRPLLDRIAPSEIYKLSVLHAKKPELVESWIAHNPEPTHRELADFLKDAVRPGYPVIYLRHIKGFPYHVIGKHGESEVKILFDRQPTDDMVWVRFKKSGIVREINPENLEEIHLERKVSR